MFSSCDSPFPSFDNRADQGGRNNEDHRKNVCHGFPFQCAYRDPICVRLDLCWLKIFELATRIQKTPVPPAVAGSIHKKTRQSLATADGLDISVSANCVNRSFADFWIFL